MTDGKALLLNLDPRPLGAVQADVLDSMGMLGESTCGDLVDHTGRGDRVVRYALRSLQRDGLVEETAKATYSPRTAGRWALTDEGQNRYAALSEGVNRPDDRTAAPPAGVVSVGGHTEARKGQ